MQQVNPSERRVRRGTRGRRSSSCGMSMRRSRRSRTLRRSCGASKSVRPEGRRAAR